MTGFIFLCLQFIETAQSQLLLFVRVYKILSLRKLLTEMH